MKYLKLYESDRFQDILDCFTDLTDNGFIVGFERNYNNKNKFIISHEINIIKCVGQFSYSDIKECLLFAIPYLCENCDIIFTGFTTYGPWLTKNFAIEDDSDIIKYINNKLFDYKDINVLTLYFYFKDVRQSQLKLYPI